MRIGKRTNPKTVGRIELLLQEVAADVLYLGKLKQTRGRQKCLHVALLDHNRRRVAEVEEQLHRVLVDVAYRDFRLPTLGQLPREHRVEVGTARGQDDAVSEDLALADVENDVAQFAVLAQDVDGFEGVARVLVGVVGHACRRRHRAVVYVHWRDVACDTHFDSRSQLLAEDDEMS